MFRIKNLRKFFHVSTFLGASLLLLLTVALGYNRFFGADASTFAPGYVVKEEKTFIVYNASKIIPKEEDRKAITENPKTKDFLIGDELWLPRNIMRPDIDNIYYENDRGVMTANTNLRKIWGGIQTAYKKVESEAINRNKNVSDAGYAQSSANEISRKISSSKPSYTELNGYFYIKNFSKHLPNKADRVALQDLFNSSEARANLGESAILEGDELKLASRIYGTTEINSLNYQAWAALMKIYNSIKTSPNKVGEQVDKTNALFSSESIKLRLDEWKQNHSKSVYERIPEGGKEYFLVPNYSKWISKDDTKKIENFHFDGAGIRAAFVGSFVKLPVQVSPESLISSHYTPLTTYIAGKVGSIYQSISDITPSTTDKVDARLAAVALEKYVDDYYARGQCSEANHTFGMNESFIFICNFSQRVSKNSNKAIVQLTAHIKQVTGTDATIEVVPATDDDTLDSDSATIPRIIDKNQVVIYDDNDKKGWKAVIELYRYIFKNARDDQAELKRDVSTSIGTIEDVIKNPPVYIIDQDETDSSKGRLRVYKSFSACKGLKQGDDKDVIIYNDFCNIVNPGYADGKYFVPKENSSAHKLLKSVLSKAKNEDDKYTIQQFLDDYESQFTGESGSGNVRITAPKLIRQAGSITPNGFQNYGTEVPIKYTVSLDESAFKQIAATGKTYKAGLAIDIHSNNENNIDKIGEYISDVKGNGEIVWTINTNPQDSPHSSIGKHKIVTHLFAYDADPSSTIFPRTPNDVENDPNIKVLSTVEHEFNIVGPNGEKEPSDMVGDPNACTGAKINSIVAPTKIRPGNLALIYANLTPPRAPKKEGEKDTYQIYVSTAKHPADKDPSTLQGNGDWSQKGGGDYVAGKTPAAEWQNAASEPGMHFIMVKTYRGPNPYDAKVYCTGKKYKTITVDLVAPEDKCKIDAAGKKTCEGEDERDTSVPGPNLDPGDGSKIETLPDLVDRVINIFFSVIGALAVLGNVIGGIMYLTAGGDSGKAEKAKKAVLYSSIAVVIAVTAYAILHASVGTINQIITGKK